MKRTCSYCNKEQPLNKKHFQVVKSFKEGYSFCCLTCDTESKKVKPRKKEEKFLKEKLEVKLQHRDLIELVTILGYYKGMIESSEEEIPSDNIVRMLEKIHHEINKHNEKLESHI
jgi:hypothetical protein